MRQGGDDFCPRAASGRSAAGPMKETVTIIIPAYNSGRDMGKCLDACLAAGAAAADIVVVDDMSSDCTVAEAEARGVMTVRLPRRSGAAAARNRGARGAAGGILVFLDADVLPAEGWLAELLDTFRRFPGADAVQGVYTEDCPAAGIPSLARNFYKCYNASKLADGAAVGGVNSFCFAVRREAFVSVGGFDPSAERAEDVDLGRRLRAAGRTIRLNKRVRVGHLKPYTFTGLLKCDFLKVLAKTDLMLESRRGASGMTFSLNGLAAMKAEVLTMALAGTVLAAPAAACLAGLPVFAWLTPAALAAMFFVNLRFFRFMQRRAGAGTAAACLAVYFCEMAVALAGAVCGPVLLAASKAARFAASAAEKARWMRKMFFRGAPGMPEQATFFVTGRCPLKCAHCFDWKNADGARRDFTLAELEKVLPTMGRFSFASLTGGEPFLRDDLPGIAGLLTEINGVTRISVPTSGFFPERTAELAAAMLDACRGRASLLVKVSLDGVGAGHDAIRGVSGSFDRAVRTFRLLKGLSRSRKGLKAGVLLTASGLNGDSLGGTAAYVMKELEPDMIGLNFARGETRDPAAARADVKVYRRVYAGILAWMEGRGGRGGSLHNAFYRAYKRNIASMISGMAGGGSYPLECRAGELTAVIDSSLDVYPCELSGERMGNLRGTGLDFGRLWSSPRAAAVRENIARGCSCTHECNLQMNSFFDPLRAAGLLLETCGIPLSPSRETAAAEAGGAV